MAGAVKYELSGIVTMSREKVEMEMEQLPLLSRPKNNDEITIDEIDIKIQPQTPQQIIHEIYYNIVEKGSLSPFTNDVNGKFSWKRYYWQAWTLLLANGLYAILAFRTGIYFKVLSKDAAAELPDRWNKKSNERLAPYASSWINIALNYTVMFGAHTTMLFWYNMSKLLKKHEFNPFWITAVGIFFVGSLWAVSSAIPFAALVFSEHPGIGEEHPDIGEAFFEQWATFSIMHGVGAYAICNITITALVRAWRSWNQKKEDNQEAEEYNKYNKEFAEDITLVTSNPNYYLEVRDKKDNLNPQDYFSDLETPELIPNQEDFASLPESEKFAWQIKCAAQWIRVNTIPLPSLPRAAAIIRGIASAAVLGVIWASLPGYYNLTVFKGMKAFYQKFLGIDMPSLAESYIGGSIAFSAFGSLLLWVVYKTVEKLQGIATQGLTRLLNYFLTSKNKNITTLGTPKPREEHPSLLRGLALFLVAVVGVGYYMGYLSSAAPHALNVEWAHLDFLWLYILNAFGSSFFNGWGVFSSASGLYDNINYMLNYTREDRTVRWNLGYANMFGGSSQKSLTNMHDLTKCSKEQSWREWASDRIPACLPKFCF